MSLPRGARDSFLTGAAGEVASGPSPDAQMGKAHLADGEKRGVGSMHSQANM